MGDLGNKEIMSRNLKYYIEKSGRDRRELADIWGFPYSTVSEWVNGRKYPRIDKIEIMADYFGIKKSDLVEDKEKPTDEDGGLPESVQKLIKFARTVPEDQADMMLDLMKMWAAQADKMKEMMKAD